MEKGQSFLKSVSWPNESLVAKHFRLERKHRITTITHGLANRCLTIRLSASDVSLSFQSASHSFSVLAPRDGVMTYQVIIRSYESRTLPAAIMPPCYRYTNRPGPPVFPGCQLPSGYSRALSMVVTTSPCLVLDSNQNLRTGLCYPLTPTKHI